MKHLYIICGPMGVGKSTTCRALKKLLAPCAFLDGDWCWDMEPFTVNEENKAMVMANIHHMLKSYLNNSSFQNVIFCWVIPGAGVLSDVLSGLKDIDFTVHTVALTCSEETLRRRIEGDVKAGLRTPDAAGRAISYLPLYDGMDIIKLSTDGMSPSEAAEAIVKISK